jgi:hypothetical protein
VGTLQRRATWRGGQDGHSEDVRSIDRVIRACQIWKRTLLSARSRARSPTLTEKSAACCSTISDRRSTGCRTSSTQIVRASSRTSNASCRTPRTERRCARTCSTVCRRCQSGCSRWSERFGTRVRARRRGDAGSPGPPPLPSHPVPHGRQHEHSVQRCPSGPRTRTGVRYLPLCTPPHGPLARRSRTSRKTSGSAGQSARCFIGWHQMDRVACSQAAPHYRRRSALSIAFRKTSTSRHA